MMGGPFISGAVVLVWDFEFVLSPGYLSTLLARFSVDEEIFWRSVDVVQHREQLPTKRRIVLPGDILDGVKAGLFPGLCNQVLFELGSEIPLYEGIPGFFDELRLKVDRFIGPRGQRVTLEQYIMSTFPEQVLAGSRVAPYVTSISACEFLESSDGDAVIDRIKSQLDPVARQRALLEIGGRIPLQNVIFVGGPGGEEPFATLKRYGGRTLAVYEPASESGFQAAKKLRSAGMVDEIGEARYAVGSPTSLWLLDTFEQVASRSLEKHPVPVLPEIGVDQPSAEGLPARANPQANPPLRELSANAARSRFEAACKSFLREVFEKHKPVLDVWYDSNAGSLSSAELQGFLTELEQSVAGTPKGRQRRSAAAENSDLAKLLNFLDNLLRKRKIR